MGRKPSPLRDWEAIGLLVGMLEHGGLYQLSVVLVTLHGSQINTRGTALYFWTELYRGVWLHLTPTQLLLTAAKIIRGEEYVIKVMRGEEYILVWA